jgi:hypothetical protein
MDRYTDMHRTTNRFRLTAALLVAALVVWVPAFAESKKISKAVDDKVKQHGVETVDVIVTYDMMPGHA